MAQPQGCLLLSSHLVRRSVTPQAPRELWPNTTPQLMAHLIDDGASRNDPIVGWARYQDYDTGTVTVEAVIVDPEHDRHLIFARECDMFQYIVDTGVIDHGDKIVKKLAAICIELNEIRANIPM